MVRMRKQAERFGTEFRVGALKSVELHERPFLLTLAEGTARTETLIIATGATARWLGLPEELEFRTRIGGGSARAAGDAFFYKDKPVLLVVGGRPPPEEAPLPPNFANPL